MKASLQDHVVTNKPIWVKIKLSFETIKKIKKIAERHSSSMPEIIHGIIEKYFDKNNINKIKRGIDMKDENAVPEVITQDRSNVHKIIEEMLDNPGKNGIYQTTKAFNKLEALLNTARLEAVGWTWATACLVVDDGLDIRKCSQSKLIEKASRDLNPPWVYDEDEGK